MQCNGLQQHVSGCHDNKSLLFSYSMQITSDDPIPPWNALTQMANLDPTRLQCDPKTPSKSRDLSNPLLAVCHYPYDNMPVMTYPNVTVISSETDGSSRNVTLFI